MSLIILFFIQLFAFSLVYHIDIVNMEVISQIFIILNLLLSIFYFNKSFPKRITIILSSALFVRILALIVDMYFHPLLFSGNDTEVFHHITVSNVANGSIDQSLTSYTDFLYYIYNLCDSQRIIAQYLNVVFGISSMIVLYKKSLTN